MMRFVQLASGVDVVPVMLEFNRAPDHMWDRNPERRLYPRHTPHSAMTDITVEYMPERRRLDGEYRGGRNTATCSGYRVVLSCRPLRPKWCSR